MLWKENGQKIQTSRVQSTTAPLDKQQRMRRQSEWSAEKRDWNYEQMDKKDREESLQEAGSRKQNRRKWRGGEYKSIMQGNRWAPRETEPQHCKGLPQHQAGWIKKRATVRQVTINLHNTINRKIPSVFREGNTSSAKKWNDLPVLWSATAFRSIAKPLAFWRRASHSQTSGHVGRVIFIHANKLSYKLSFDSSREVTWGYTPGKWESKLQKRKKKWRSGI